jgi:predicted extracellular nuclease
MLRRLPGPAAPLLCLALAACGATGYAPADGENGARALRVGAVQGSEARSPRLGERVELQGVVTGNFVAGLDGFFLQDAAGEEDGDPATSDGIFVHWPRGSAPKVRRGDRVRVAGTVAERGEGKATQTTLEATDVAPLGRGAAAVTTIAAPPAARDDWERLEGMWLRIAAPLTVSGNDALLRWGELHATFGGRRFQPTETHPPGAQARVAESDNARRLLLLDDNRRGDFPPTIWFLPEGFGPEQPLRSGSVLHDVEGVLAQRHGWRLQLSARLERIEQAERPAPPKLPSGVRAASFNVLNYFNGNGRGGGFPTERGASTAEELGRQRDKLVAAIAAVEPDVAALMELENDGYGDRSSLVELVEALNRHLGKDTYRYIGTGRDAGPGRDAIRVGLIYRPARLKPQGAPALREDGPFAEHSRVPLAQAFATVEGGHVFTVVANHFKSKGGCEEAAAPGDRDQGDGQGCWNATRLASAQALLEWLAVAPDGSDGQRVLILGDLNAYAQEDPVRALRAAGWRDAFEIAGRKKPYSFVWAGLAGRLDHAFASPALAPHVAAAREWHINADESEAFDYNREHRQGAWYRADPYRAADHDPLLVVLDFARR